MFWPMEWQEGLVIGQWWRALRDKGSPSREPKSTAVDQERVGAETGMCLSTYTYNMSQVVCQHPQSSALGFSRKTCCPRDVLPKLWCWETANLLLMWYLLSTCPVQTLKIQQTVWQAESLSSANFQSSLKGESRPSRIILVNNTMLLVLS